MRRGAAVRQSPARCSPRRARTQWPWPIVAFYSGAEKPDTLLEKAKTGPAEEVASQLCEAEYHIGVALSAGTDQTQARRWFESAVKNCPKTDFERTAAVMELKRLDGLTVSQSR